MPGDLYQDTPTRERGPYEGDAFQFAAFEALARCADVLGRTGDAALLRRRAERLRGDAHSPPRPFRGALHRWRGHRAQHATALPVALGVADALPDAVRRDLGATLAAGGMRMSVYGAQSLLDALFRLGRADAALSLLTSRGTSSWLHMLDGLHATIVTEAWDPAQKPSMTFSHAWASAPANAIARHVLGVQVTDPDAAGFFIRPRTGSLRDVKGTVPSLRGTVSVAHHRSAASYEAMTADGLRGVHLTARTDLRGIVLRRNMRRRSQRGHESCQAVWPSFLRGRPYASIPACFGGRPPKHERPVGHRPIHGARCCLPNWAAAGRAGQTRRLSPVPSHTPRRSGGFLPLPGVAGRRPTAAGCRGTVP
ncbi:MULTISPECIES: hypothetical protein [unclassified Streptomyces]|uniref:alpha-L-rhamnosidase-related protein n=1 Tax=unclassified Streptomyces TaxID=2593676 RepID=UPI001319C9C9|nr:MULTISPECIES: hypothetical protein [unclassified Streptomyces]MYQ76053.1 hypothetical protein [Streptomyces sp. SID4923]